MAFDTFTLELKISDQCSMRCPYCYETFTDKYMTKEVFDESLVKIINMMERSNTKKLNVSFFGGEPMMNWNLIEYATKIFKKLPIDVELVIISNMTLIDEEKVKFIKENNLGVSWSFDGISSNETRPLATQFINPKADGTKYSSTLELYKDKIDLISQVTNGCKAMVWPGNSNQMAENLEFFVSMGIPSPDFSLVRDDVWSKQDIINFRTDIKKLGDKYIEYIKNGTYVNVGFFTLCILDNLLGLTYQKRSFGCFAGTTGAVMTTDGKFYPCARFSDKKVMEITPEYSFTYWQEKFNPVNFDKCKSCDLYDVCNAGCTYSQIRNDNKPLDSICELFHIIQEETQRIVHELKEEPTFQAVVKNALSNMG